MPSNIKGCENHAEECARPANQTNDEVVRADLLKLRQTDLAIAKRLRKFGFDTPDRGH